MIQTVPKWKVTVSFSSRDDVVLWIYDSHLSNAMRTVAAMQFTEDGLEQPTSIHVGVVGVGNSIIANQALSGIITHTHKFERYNANVDTYSCACGEYRDGTRMATKKERA